MKTNLVVGLAIAGALAGCGGPEITSIKGPSGTTEYLVDCGHHGFDGGSWTQCYEKAAEACPTGYAIHDKSQEAGPLIANSGIKRALLIACKA